MKLLLYISLCFLPLALNAQFNPCIEPGRVQPFYMCNDPFYNPVCGCDNKTYRNQCNAYFVNGVSTWTSGVCAGLDVDMFPNPVLYYEPFTVNLSYPDNIMGNAVLAIVDMYGKVWQQRIINNFNRTMIQFDVYAMPTGVYLLVVQSNLQTGVVRKFSKN